MSPRAPFGLATAAVAFTLAACGGGSESAKPPAASAAPPAATSPAATSPAATSAAATTSSAEFGVPECDDYFKKYLACVDSKVPEAARATVRQGLDQTKAAWKQAASTPEGKASLATGCKAATEAAKTTMTAYGCTW